MMADRNAQDHVFDPGIVWEDPPNARRGRSGIILPWKTWAKALRLKPGVWGKLETFPKGSTAGNQSKKQRDGLVPDMPPSEFETKGTKISNHGSALYGRFIGGDNDS